MDHIWITEEYTGEDVDKRTGKVERWTEYVSPVYKTWATKIGDLFRALRHEHGRCIGYLLDAEGRKVGWRFEKIAYYEDTQEPYKRTVSVTVATPEKYPVQVIKMMHKPVEIA